MSDAPAPRPRKSPWDFHPALTEDRLAAAARLLVQGREDALAQADYWAGDDAWSIGCRAYSFSRHQVRRAADAGRYPWLKVLDDTHHFVFLIDGVPVRFFRGDAEDPSKRTLRQQQDEAEQLSLAFGKAGAPDGLMFRLAVETDSQGGVRRVVFLALRGEEGQAECFWPVPLQPAVETPAPVRSTARRGAAPVAQLAFGAAPAESPRHVARPRRSVAARTEPRAAG